MCVCVSVILIVGFCESVLMQKMKKNYFQLQPLLAVIIFKGFINIVIIVVFRIHHHRQHYYYYCCCCWYDEFGLLHHVTNNKKTQLYA